MLVLRDDLKKRGLLHAILDAMEAVVRILVGHPNLDFFN